MQIVINSQGTVVSQYVEAIDLSRLGSPKIRRASHVEPDVAGQWFADLSPVAGPRLGPFPRRSEALEAETDWIESNVLT